MNATSAQNCTIDRKTCPLPPLKDRKTGRFERNIKGNSRCSC